MPTFLGLALVTVVFDVIIFLLPIPFLWKLQINARRRVVLIGMFLVGLFTTICSIMRMLRIFPLAVDGNSTMLVLWGTIELNVGVSISRNGQSIAESLTTAKVALTCVPALSPLFSYFRDGRSRRQCNRQNNNSYELQRSEQSAARQVRTAVTASHNNESQTAILAPERSANGHANRQSGIMVTVQTVVDSVHNLPPLPVPELNGSQQRAEWL